MCNDVFCRGQNAPKKRFMCTNKFFEILKGHFECMQHATVHVIDHSKESGVLLFADVSYIFYYCLKITLIVHRTLYFVLCALCSSHRNRNNNNSKISCVTVIIFSFSSSKKVSSWSVMCFLLSSSLSLCLARHIYFVFSIFIRFSISFYSFTNFFIENDKLVLIKRKLRDWCRRRLLVWIWFDFWYSNRILHWNRGLKRPTKTLHFKSMNEWTNERK